MIKENPKWIVYQLEKLLIELLQEKSEFLLFNVILFVSWKMSIFSLDKGGKEHEVFEMRMGERGVSNSYIQTIFDRCCAALENERKITYRKKTWKFELPEPVKDYPIDYVLDGQ